MMTVFAGGQKEGQMTTNRDWLFSLPLEEQYAWMNAEHQERALDGDTEPQDADSRERLEADAKRYIKYAADYAYEDVLWAGETFTLHDAVIELLDRQAAITLAKDEAYCQECNGDYYKLQDERDELQEQVDELKAERVKLRSQICKLEDDLVGTSDERDEWKSRWEIGKAQFDAIIAERELYREALSQLLDTVTDGMGKVSAILDNYDEGMA